MSVREGTCICISSWKCVSHNGGEKDFSPFLFLSNTQALGPPGSGLSPAATQVVLKQLQEAVQLGFSYLEEGTTVGQTVCGLAMPLLRFSPALEPGRPKQASKQQQQQQHEAQRTCLTKPVHMLSRRTLALPLLALSWG